MAGRKPKKGLDWFPLRTDVFTDPKIMDIIQNGDTEAWAVYTSVLILIYGNEGYYSDRESIERAVAWIFRKLSRERVEECLDMLVDAGLLDRDAYEKGILTSHGIQAHYEAAGKRRVESPAMKYWLISDDNNSTPSVVSSISANRNSISADINTSKGEFMHAEMQHSIEENRRVENSIKENSKEDNNIPTYKDNTVTKKIEEVGRSGQSDFDDVFIPSYSEAAERINKMLEAETYMGPREYKWVRDMTDALDERTVTEAVMRGIQAKREGRLKGSLLKYVNRILHNWNNGEGGPEWVLQNEMQLQEQKEEYMKPSKFKEVFVDG